MFIEGVTMCCSRDSLSALFARGSNGNALLALKLGPDEQWLAEYRKIT